MVWYVTFIPEIRQECENFDWDFGGLFAKLLNVKTRIILDDIFAPLF